MVTMKIYLCSYGCNQNIGEGEAMLKLIEGHGHTIVNNANEADASIIVTCAVIEHTERRMFKEIEKLSKQNSKVIVSGCLAEIKKEKIESMSNNISVLSIRRESDIVKVIGGVSNHYETPKYKITETLSINQGCISNCTYCITKIARGKLVSVDINTLYDMGKRYVNNNTVELRLSSQDASSYGYDGKSFKLNDLIDKIASIDNKFFIRVGMMSPYSAKPIFNKIMDSYKNGKVFKFLHLPVQSGSDKILSAMRRGYNVDQFLKMVQQYRELFPYGTISTDVIIGYPGETDDDVEMTIDLLKKATPDIVNVTRWSRREGTRAYNLKGFPERLLKERSRKITEIRFKISREVMEKYIGKEVNAVVLEHKDASSIARDINYKPIVINRLIPLGYRVHLKIRKATPLYLVGEETYKDY